MNERIRQLAVRAKEQTEEFNSVRNKLTAEEWEEIYNEKFAELILANADELKREVSTDPINKPFELNPKFIAKCDELGRSRRQFQ